jgi:N utilization substance protein A
MELLGKDGPSTDEANDIIMAARAHWFADDAGSPAAGAAG